MGGSKDLSFPLQFDLLKGYLKNHWMRGFLSEPRDEETPDTDKCPLGRIEGYGGQLFVQEREKVWLNFGMNADGEMGDGTKIWLLIGHHPDAPLHFNAE